MTSSYLKAVKVVSVAGVLSSVISTSASAVVALGWTPSWLYGQVRPITPLLRLSGIPAEYFGLTWFVMVLVLVELVLRGTITPRAFRRIVAVTGVLVAGLGLFVSLSYTPTAWVVAFSTFAAATIVGLVSFFGDADAERTETTPGPGWPVPLAAVSVALAVSVVGAQAMRVAVSRVEPKAAQQASFDHWFVRQGRSARPDFMPSAGIRIVVFTDYQCPSCAASIPSAQVLVRDASRRWNVPIEMVVEDFPLELECNDSVERDTHPASCEAAAAVRLARAKHGADAAARLERAFYRRGNALLAIEVFDDLERVGLLAEFREKYASLITDIRRAARRAADEGVLGTPTYFVNGVRLPSSDLLERALHHESKRLAKFNAADLRPDLQR
jgi:protein-disulfide isomerase